MSCSKILTLLHYRALESFVEITEGYSKFAIESVQNGPDAEEEVMIVIDDGKQESQFYMANNTFSILPINCFYR